MNGVVEKDTAKVESKIYEIRGKRVMLDSDLARLYECKNGTKDIKKAVNRNEERFPSDFYFQLTMKETKNLWFQFGTANKMSRNMLYDIYIYLINKFCASFFNYCIY